MLLFVLNVSVNEADSSVVLTANEQRSVVLHLHTVRVQSNIILHETHTKVLLSHGEQKDVNSHAQHEKQHLRSLHLHNSYRTLSKSFSKQRRSYRTSRNAWRSTLGEQPTRLGVKWQPLLQHSQNNNSKDIQGRCAGSILD